MGVNGKKKGSKNEREVCVFLNEWSGLDFKRVPQSGGLRGHIMEYTVGDIICVDKTLRNKVFPYSIEAKSYNTIDFSKLLEIPSKPSKNNPQNYMVCEIDKFWAQCVADSQRGEKLPLLIMRYNSLPKLFYFIILDRKLVTRSMLPSVRILTKKYVITTSEAFKTEIKWTNFFKQSLKLWKNLYG